MRFPERNSRYLQILEVLRGGAKSIDQGIESHGYFCTQKRPYGETRARIEKMYAELVERDCVLLDKATGKYSLTVRCLDRLRKMDAPVIRPVTPPPYRNPWTREMQPGTLFKRVYRRDV
jgi:hypothetical protein